MSLVFPATSRQRSTHCSALRPLPVLRAKDSASEALGVVLREAVVQGVLEAQGRGMAGAVKKNWGASPAKMEIPMMNTWFLNG